MYWIRNCQNHFSLFDGKNGGCYQCNLGFVVSKDRRSCIDLKPYLEGIDSKESRDLLSCRIFKNERPGDCEPKETDWWTGTDPDFGEFGVNDNSYSSSTLNGIRIDYDCQAPPLPVDNADGDGGLEGGDGGGGGLGGGIDDLRARTLAKQALESGHWECGECLKDAVAQTNNMKCTAKRKTLSFNFKPKVNYTNVDQSVIEVLHYDDSFNCTTKDTKKP
jgi:hypothetical protein